MVSTVLASPLAYSPYCTYLATDAGSVQHICFSPTTHPVREAAAGETAVWDDPGAASTNTRSATSVASLVLHPIPGSRPPRLASSAFACVRSPALRRCIPTRHAAPLEPRAAMCALNPPSTRCGGRIPRPRRPGPPKAASITLLPVPWMTSAGSTRARVLRDRGRHRGAAWCLEVVMTRGQDHRFHRPEVVDGGLTPWTRRTTPRSRLSPR